MSLNPALRTPSLVEMSLFAPGIVRAPIERAGAWRWSDALTSAAAIIAFMVVAGSLWPLSGSVVPWDSKNQFYPFFRFLADTLARGDFPLWNPFHFAGHPAIADPQSLIFTPTMGLFALLAPRASMYAFDAVILAHLTAGGLGVLGLFARRPWRPAGAVLAALVFMFAGSASSRLQHTGMIISYSFFPLALWALEAALERRSHAIGVLFAVLAALMALGRDQVAFLFCGALILAAASAMAQDRQPLLWLARRWTVLVLMAAVGAALMAVPVLLTLQFLGASNRPGIPYGVAATGSLTPVNFVSIAVPNIFGTLDWNYDYWGPSYEITVEPDWTDRAVNYLFIGAFPALLALWHGIACGRLFARGPRYFTMLAIVAGFYAVGRYTPVFALIFDHVPGVALYRRPADASFMLNFALAMGAGYLLHRYIADGLPRPWRDWPRAAAYGLVGAAVLGWGALIAGALQLSAQGGHLSEAARALGLAAALSAAAAGALLIPRDLRGRSIAAAIACLATMGELIWRDACSSLNSEPVSNYSVFANMNPTEKEALATLRADIAARNERGEFPRVEILGLSGPWQNAAIVLGLEDTLGYNPLRISAYERAVGPGENAGDPNLRQFPGMFRGYRSKLASLLGLEYLILDRPLAKLPRHFPRPLATPLFMGEHIYVYRLSQPAPRAYLATQILPVDSEAAIDDHTLPVFDRSHQALIEQADMANVSAEVTRGDANPAIDPHVHVVAHHTDNVVIEVDCDRPGVLVLHDLYYPGWRAAVDGADKPVLRANILFRGVEVAAGHHVVEFTFEPLSPANLKRAAQDLLTRQGDE